MRSALNHETGSFEAVLQQFAHRRILVIGDVMLDRFIYGDVKRISPEAPAAVIHVRNPENAPGGAANVALNICSLGAACDLIGLVGDDGPATELMELVASKGIRPLFVRARDRCTTVKMRFVADMHNTHMLRADWEDTAALGRSLEDELLAQFRGHVSSADAVILSDYAKGVLSGRVIEAVITESRRFGKPVIVDPKGSDYSRYRGATTLTPNVAELSVAVGRTLANETDSLVEAATQVIQSTGCNYLLVTRSEKGILLVHEEGGTETFAPTARNVVDVSGAGDTLAGGFALALAAGAGPRNAARLANMAAGIVVGRKGTVVVQLPELRSELLSRPRFADDGKVATAWSDVVGRADTWRHEGLTVGFTNGCFDLLHPGHIHLLRSARSRCDRLIVGLNSDQSIKRLKGAKRPIQNQFARATVIAALAFVDAVVIFDQDTPIELLTALEPDVLIKGSDYRPDDVVGKELVESYGGRVELISLLPDNSTSTIVQKILEVDVA